MGRSFQRLIAFVTVAALCFALCGCQDIIEEIPMPSETVDSSVELPPELDDGASAVGEFYGSYLTMYTGHVPADVRGLPYIRVLRSYEEVEEYFDSTEHEHVYGRLFTLAMLSFTDEFLAENDVLVLALEEPSSYINHTAEPIAISDDKISISITRHTPEESPMLKTVYHLLFTAPKGSFDGVEDMELELNISEVVDTDNNAAYDAALFRIFRPDFTPLIYRTDQLTADGAGVVVDAIDGYNELVYFYDKYKSDFDLDSSFKGDVGTLYNWEICDRYVLVAMIIPCSSEKEPQITDLFVKNLEMFFTVEADTVSDGEKPKACYLLLTGIERRDLEGVDLSLVNLSVE